MKLIIQDIPPSNNKFMGRGTRYIQSIQYQEEKTKWEWLVKSALGRRSVNHIEKATVKITYYFKDRRRRDPDNYSGKFILDGLVRANILKDDSFSNIDLVLIGEYDKENPRTEIEIQEATKC
ncbi:RusA family crossover junction endodeoxyribonuclease [Garciella nitratireducens]|uniref:Holliday junction resolvase RusA (Prophage-encoded endonuclease) n=1 Tax=Garciella nitratireducens DSM 15102 TaxID=1121911 RepID=A0A1T4K727_9FIRM|nr:RusA family crossover junction endodeoxyribonuclease [Garciella nitratireducens]SJZ38229.1 Holliday junction resolvase RusA (prophage-encoded endonuclease) [Garciella nitratireducens DSM 15102]